MRDKFSKLRLINSAILTMTLMLLLPLLGTANFSTILLAQKAAATPTTTSNAEEALVSVDIKEVALTDILKFMEQQFPVKFILAADTPKIFVTTKAKNVPWAEVVGATLQANNLAYQIVADKWYISPSTTVTTLSRSTKSTIKYFGDPDFSSDLATLDVKNVPLVDILRYYSDTFKFSYTLPQALLKLKVTIKTENQPWHESLGKALTDNHLRYSHTGNVIYILPN